jgi:hypothetical protein
MTLASTLQSFAKLGDKMMTRRSSKTKKELQVASTSRPSSADAPAGPRRHLQGSSPDSELRVPAGIRSESNDSMPLVLGRKTSESDSLSLLPARFEEEDAPAERPHRAHVEPFERFLSPSMAELKKAMEDDACMQKPVAALVGQLLDLTVVRNDAQKRNCGFPEYESKEVKMKASNYLMRMIRYGKCSECCVIVALIYMTRLKKRHTSVCITSCNMQRLLLVAVMVAHKYLDDIYFSNEHWAEIGGISNKELNQLELLFLFHLRFSCNVTRESYDEYLHGLGSGAWEGMLEPPTTAPAAESA